jgi:hypothetical protein
VVGGGGVLGWWFGGVAAKMLDPRPNVTRSALTCDCYVTAEGLVYVTDWNAGLHVLQYEG